MKKRILLPVLLFLAFSGFQAMAQRPEVTVRFANPQYDCHTQTYCLDVEFISDTPGLQLFGMNFRFFYDDDVLEYLSVGDYAMGYGSALPPDILPGVPGSNTSFGIPGPLVWFNGSLDLLDPSTVYLSTTDWTKLCNVCFHVDDPNSLNVDNFCPSIIWDLQENPPESGGGYYNDGDDGVVITVVDPNGIYESTETTEDVVQFNWEYGGNPNGFGHPVDIICISTQCFFVPLSNWALFLAIGMMLVASVFIYRRRMSS